MVEVAKATVEVAERAMVEVANVLEVDLEAAVLSKLKKNAAKYPVGEFKGRY